ncbi:hypothetical protein Pint_30236 [Pistacia integerrima]|uniref:Uncharacterized protein n=1 Tax=Pistacia integerrima TaxID=434235 RepID=A0ACC0WYV0_9ROSI|nr:hypothetical protein Pint_30236 [Pistacia integerrima]
MECRWSAGRLESAAEVIVNVLLEKKTEKFGRSGMSRRKQEKQLARKQIDDTGLLDYVLKSMNNVIVGDHIMHRPVNPSTRLLEYTIHELCNGEELEAFEPGADVSSEVVFFVQECAFERLDQN